MLLHFLRDTGKLVPTSVHPHHVLTDGMLLHPNPLCYHTDSAGNSCATICQSCLASRGYAFLDQLHFQGGSMNSFIINAAITDSSYRLTDHLLYGTLQLDCHGSGRDACPQGRPGVARPSDTSAKNIGRKECRESRRKHMDRSDGSGREYRRIGRTHQITCRLEISVLIAGLDMIG